MIIQFGSGVESLIPTNSTRKIEVTPNRFFHDRTASVHNFRIYHNTATETEIALGFKHAGGSIFETRVFGGDWTESIGAYLLTNDRAQVGISEKDQWLRASGDDNSLEVHFNTTPQNAGIVFDYFAVLNLGKIRPEEKDRLELPRFRTFPKYGWEEIGGGKRGGIGQPYGRVIRRLKTFSVSFERIHNDVLEEYYFRAGTAEPHWVAPYAQAIAKFPPMWATLAAPPEYTKRDEAGWYYNVDLSWKEAY